MRAAVGVHPHDASDVDDAALDEIARLAARCRSSPAIGETGLDYHYDNSPREAQTPALRALRRDSRAPSRSRS